MMKKMTAQEAYDLGMEAYQYFYPLAMTDTTRRVMTNLPPGQMPGFGPANTFNHFREYPDPDYKVVVRPSFDTLYSPAWLDLTKEPMVVSVPDTGGRYYVLEMADMWMDVFAAPGWRTSGTGAGDFAIVPRGWSGKLPASVQRIDSPTPYVLLANRIKTDGPSDYDAVHKIQDGFKITPLSQWESGMQQQPQTVTQNPTIDVNTPPINQVNNMPAGEFFTYVTELLKINPPNLTDWSQLERLKRIGIEQGKSFEFDKLDQETRQALNRVPKDAQKLMAEKLTALVPVINGWTMDTELVGTYGSHYLKRGVTSIYAFVANQPEDAIYPLLQTDAEGNPLSGGNSYILHFEKNEIPPADAFWSMTMYDVDGYAVPNELNRYTISSWMPLKYNADGSLDVYVQRNNPGADKQSNWLPGPTGSFGITMRLYAPRPEALDGTWSPPAVKRTIAAERAA
jgi:hypothetical protein